MVAAGKAELGLKEALGLPRESQSEDAFAEWELKSTQPVGNSSDKGSVSAGVAGEPDFEAEPSAFVQSTAPVELPAVPGVADYWAVPVPAVLPGSVKAD
jgi:hypothetical protein